MSPNRIHARVPLSLEVQYRTAGAFLVAYTVNLSRGGLFVETRGELPAAGTQLTVTLHVPGVETPLELTGRVAWVRDTESEGKPRGFGLELDSFDQRYGAAVDKLVHQFDRLKIAVVAWASGARSQIVRYLRNILSCEILECQGTDAARAAFELPVDLAIVDMDACADDGPALLTLAQAGVQPATPVIALARDEALRSRARDLGAADTIVAPPPFAALQAAVVKTLARPAIITPTGPAAP